MGDGFINRCVGRFFRCKMEEVDESNQMLVVVVDVNPNQLLFARSTGLIVV